MPTSVLCSQGKGLTEPKGFTALQGRRYIMSKQTAHEFVSNYYDVEKGVETCERKSFIRFYYLND